MGADSLHRSVHLLQNPAGKPETQCSITQSHGKHAFAGTALSLEKIVDPSDNSGPVDNLRDAGCLWPESLRSMRMLILLQV